MKPTQFSNFEYGNKEPSGKSALFQSVGKQLARIDDGTGLAHDTLQHNYVSAKLKPKQVQSTENLYREMEQIKKLASDIDLDEVQKLNPTAYNNYMANLQKQNENLRKMDEYADFVNRERDRINREQLNMNNVNTLNQLNAKQHKQALDYAYQKLKEGKAPSLPSFDRGRDKRIPDTPSKNVNRNYIGKHGLREEPRITDPNDSQLDSANRLLDDYSVKGNDSTDPLAGFMRNQQPNWKKIQAQADDDSDQPVLQEENYRPKTFNQFPQQQQYMPQQQYPMPQQYGAPYPQQLLPNQVQPIMPNYNMFPYPYPTFPSPNLNRDSARDKERDNELKLSLEKQAMLLENLGKTLETNLIESKNKPSSQDQSRSRLDSREFEKRLQEYERENDLKQMLARQQEKIEALERERLEKDRLRSKQGNSRNASRKEELSKEQNKLIAGMLNPSMLGNHYMQHLNPFQYNMSPYMMNAMMNPMAMNGQYMMNPMYNGMQPGFNTGLEPQKKKTGKKKKKSSKKNDDDNEDQDEPKNPKEKKSKKEKQKEKEKEKEKEALIQKQNLEKKARNRAKLKMLLWTMVYPSLFFRDMTLRMVGVRQSILENLDTVIRDSYEKLALWIKTGMRSTIKSFDSLKPESWDFLRTKETKTQLKVKEGCLSVIRQLSAITTENLLDQESALFLGNISMDSVYIPSGLLSAFEINRLNFSPGLKRLVLNHENGQLQTQMILTCTILFRILIYSLLLKPWEAYDDFLNKGILIKTNLRILSSVIYQIAIGYLRQMISVVDPQNHLHQELEPLAPLFADQMGAVGNTNPQIDEVINGLMSINELSSFLMNESMCKEIREGIIQWAQKIFVIVLNTWVATNQKIEELKKNPNDPNNAENLKSASDNPYLTAMVNRALLNGYRNMTGTPENDQIALR